jgi:hypothetical protein
MNKDIAKQLKEFSIVVRNRYSNHNRDNNFNKETFEVQEIIPTSDHSATIIFEKNTNKRCAMFFYYIPAYKKWNYFVPTDSHINGMSCFANQKIEVERHNYKYNFN